MGRGWQRPAVGRQLWGGGRAQAAPRPFQQMHREEKLQLQLHCDMGNAKAAVSLLAATAGVGRGCRIPLWDPTSIAPSMDQLLSCSPSLPQQHTCCAPGCTRASASPRVNGRRKKQFSIRRES